MLLPIFFAVLFIFPPFILAIVLSIICGIAAYELLHATNFNKNKSIIVYTIISAALVPIAVYFSTLFSGAPALSSMADGSLYIIPRPAFSPLTLITLLLLTFFIFASLLLIEFVLRFRTEKRVKFLNILVALCAGLVIPYMLASLVSLKAIPSYGHLFVLLPVVSTILTDSGAYFIGVGLGKTKAFPKISPNKTVEGCVGGIIIGTAGMMIYGMILSSATSLTIIFPALIVYGIVGAIITEFGDLAFSFIKRKCEIKDYGRLIPGHGGVLDRFDSLIFTAPAMYLLVMILPAIVVI